MSVLGSPGAARVLRAAPSKRVVGLLAALAAVVLVLRTLACVVHLAALVCGVLAEFAERGERAVAAGFRLPAVSEAFRTDAGYVVTHLSGGVR